jgi:uncharacterized membrane protein YdjX (TVP38/TMEM64 family)
MARAIPHGTATDRRERRRARRRLVALGAVGVGGAIVAAAVAEPAHDEFSEMVWALGPAAPIGFIALYGGLSLLLVPGALLTLAAGVFFGPVQGAAVAFAGGVLGSTAAFLIGRALGRDAVERLTGDRLRKVDRWLTDHGVLTFALVRIVPGVPYSLLNYAAGLTGIPARQYVKGSLLGLVPGAVAYASLGGALHDPLSVEFLGALALIGAVLLAGALAERRVVRRAR